MAVVRSIDIPGIVFQIPVVRAVRVIFLIVVESQTEDSPCECRLIPDGSSGRLSVFARLFIDMQTFQTDQSLVEPMCLFCWSVVDVRGMSRLKLYCWNCEIVRILVFLGVDTLAVSNIAVMVSTKFCPKFICGTTVVEPWYSTDKLGVSVIACVEEIAGWELVGLTLCSCDHAFVIIDAVCISPPLSIGVLFCPVRSKGPFYSPIGGGASVPCRESSVVYSRKIMCTGLWVSMMITGLHNGGSLWIGDHLIDSVDRDRLIFAFHVSVVVLIVLARFIEATYQRLLASTRDACQDLVR